MEETKSSVKVSLTASDLEVDGVILCIGVKPNVNFVRPSEIKMDKGILVDEKMQTSASDVYAAGDVAQATNCLSQTRELIPLWANACLQGRVAGSNMVKVRDVFPGSIPQNITHFFNLFFVSVGDTRNYDEIQKQIDSHSTLYSFKSQGKTVGLNILSVEDYERINAVGILRQEIMRNINGGIR
jgi:NADPH-dependent 2,4-dienoyl-CoA reductase/sulfur reductase-like enzyme